MSYAEGGGSIEGDRMDTPAFHRNHTYVVDVLNSELSSVEGHVLEVGSGSGQHAVVYAEAFPGLMIWPTDFNPAHVKSAEAWRIDFDLPNLQKPFQLDAAAENWDNLPQSDLAAIISLNMVHISPITVAEGLFRGAGKHLNDTGKLFLYGPFMQNGQHTSLSNAEFDATLRGRNPAWGIRDQVDLEKFAANDGLKLARSVAMPANNFTLIFERDPSF